MPGQIISDKTPATTDFPVILFVSIVFAFTGLIEQFKITNKISMKNKILSLTLVSLIGLPSLAATTTTTKEVYTKVSDKKPEVTYVTDRSIRSSLDELIDNRADLDDDVSFSVKDGVVTLRGVVDNNMENKDAVDLANSVRGVGYVVDKLISEEAGIKKSSNVNYSKTTTKTYHEDIK
jgi:hypothetical protein